MTFEYHVEKGHAIDILVVAGQGHTAVRSLIMRDWRCWTSVTSWENGIGILVWPKSWFAVAVLLTDYAADVYADSEDV